jgi:hypothetical protein
VKVKAKVSRGSKKRIRRTVSPTSARISPNSGGSSRLSQYEKSNIRLAKGIITSPDFADGGLSTDTTTPLRNETLSMKPGNTILSPIAEVKKAVTGVRSEMSFPYMSDASFAEMTFLFIKAELAEFYAALFGKGMGLEVTPNLLVSFDSFSSFYRSAV